MDRVSFTIPGIPTAWARARLNGRAHFTPGKQRAAAGLIQSIAYEAMAGRAPIETPVAVHISAVWPWPKSWSEKKRKIAGAHWKTSKPDADNVGKLVNDAINGIVWRDDAQVTNLVVRKTYGMTPATHVNVEILYAEET